MSWNNNYGLEQLGVGQLIDQQLIDRKLAHGWLADRSKDPSIPTRGSGAKKKNSGYFFQMIYFLLLGLCRHLWVG